MIDSNQIKVGDFVKLKDESVIKASGRVDEILDTNFENQWGIRKKVAVFKNRDDTFNIIAFDLERLEINGNPGRRN